MCATDYALWFGVGLSVLLGVMFFMGGGQDTKGRKIWSRVRSH